MKAAERRQKIIDILNQTQVPISASVLAGQLGVSRQIIVGDVALLRAANHDVISTPRGYVLSQALYSHQFIGKIACQHGPEHTKVELESVISKGGIMVDVEVEHPIYGMLTAPLNIKSQEDIDNFMEKVEHSNATLLSSLTDGIHTHTLSCHSKDEFEEIKSDLSDKGLLLKSN
ncbi:DNA-binding protein [Streptococcus equinus]|nr:DNA-binding protein [Streptococcus equinus]